MSLFAILVFSIVVFSNALQGKVFKCSNALQDTCKAPYHRIADGCYYFSTETVARDSAAYVCWLRGAWGYLATFETLEEAMLVKNELLKRNKGLYYYVGGRNLDRNNPAGDWRWIKKGEMLKMTYFIFPKGQPNGTPNNPQECMGFDPYLHYNLNDLYCDNASARDFWLGGTDEVIEGVWVWATTGKDLTYTNWFPGDQYNWETGENCVVMGKWYTWNMERPRVFLFITLHL
ncbi:unnamed protein product [Mytilus edulis]|uniref:C-type lectin domain-containing protein n=1 Tax=Mytilus edulis TaxID=6550 RepID=A0A8S3TPC7_MYTED|nr:unnamed protein product [Mytilus edulis]